MMRPCIGCGQTDDHPRHVIGLPDGSDVYWHHDCHALSSADCAICHAVVESAGHGTVGDELREHIVTNDPGAEVARALNDAHATSFKLER